MHGRKAQSGTRPSLIIFGSHALSPPVQVELRSSWPVSDSLLELLETIYIEESEAFFPLLNSLTNPETLPNPPPLTPEDVHRHALEAILADGYLSVPGVLAAVEMDLALHAATPKLEAFYQYYADRHASRLNETRQDCESWVDWYGEVVCDAETLAQLAGVETIDPPDLGDVERTYSRPKLLPFDHIQPHPDRTLDTPPRTAVLYASLSSRNFRELHEYLYAASTVASPHVEYVFRPIPSGNRDPAERVYLSGYGVALDMKKMDYLALDDRWQGIGLKATQLIHDSDEPLSTLIHLSQNFPRHATSLSRRVTVSEDVEAEVQNNHAKVAPGGNMAWLNGMLLQEKDMNPFGLLRLLRRERTTMLSLTSLGLSPGQAVELLTHDAIVRAQGQSSVLDGIFDASDRPEEGELLRPMYPGQFPNIRANVFNVVLAVDLSQSSSIHFLAVTVSNIINRNFPFRWGLAPIVETEEGAQMARLVSYLIEHFGNVQAMEFLRFISQADKPIEALAPTVDWALVRSTFSALMAQSEIPEGLATDLDKILAGAVDAPTINTDKARAYAQRLGVTLSSAPHGHVFVNGKHFDLDDAFLRAMQIEFGGQMAFLQEKIATGKLTDEELPNISTYFYDQPTSAKRRNAYIYPSGKTDDLQIFSLLDLVGKNGFPRQSESFVYPPESERVSLTTYIVADFDTKEGISLVKEVLTAVTSSYPSRVSFIHNPANLTKAPSTVETASSSLLAQLICQGILHHVPPSRLVETLGLEDASADEQSSQVVLPAAGSLDDILHEGTLSNKEYDDYVRSSRLIVRDLKLEPGEQALIVNGRVVGPFEPEEFVAEDLGALATYEMRTRVQPVIDALESIYEGLNDLDRASYTDIVTLASSIVSSIQLPDASGVGLFNAPEKPRQRRYQLLDGEYTAHIFGDNTTAMYHFGIVLDPLSEAAQKWSSLIQWLLHIPGVYTELHINPAVYGELPLKRFYRYNLLPRPTFHENGEEVHAKTKFIGLPVEPIYTLAMDVPQSWLARPREALHDLDNILLGALSAHERDRGVHAVFDLDYLVIEGHAREPLTHVPPRGVQLQLVTHAGTAIADTQVVANLGYLQFRTKPGVFHLEIRPGSGREIFEMESVGNEGWDSSPVDEVGNEITLTSFEGLTLYPRLRRRPGMDRADVLADAVEGSSAPKGLLTELTSRLSSIFAGHKNTDLASSGSGQADINIFTVASGLLYERFASIMILSVLRNTNTQSTVKFWFIENFLSPSFLEFIPHFAKEYGFQYELVTYKWPSWLRAQKEKQRIIWAYKILFLDVLFPMDLKKVIFVDADQIVRTDLKELVDLDLHGAPYGYTPMGDDNVEMEGFRFWKTGYWKEFLHGMAYHISALYVVDLVRFRQIAAGDKLRGHYQQLSADPNSLANLDQDLPNNLQREVPIFSLPEDWLWVCSKDRLHRAKTIDLCQNPLTKEPKLARARQIPEWEEYDGEIANFARRLAEDGRMRSEIVAADVNVLADVGAARVAPGSPIETQEHSRDEL
ncbi:glycosyltransferase family 24 protein [Postia placenta MAD-698-R-SB12]|uniref:Glycosyltransferase family 24 protein n=1 Tax=Postia placenta MAD-698-R-SB12 TaxID=670580 RepID=A0A1X6MY12_9APHY|nr:glycosyltransferase family 24 protein [Postia placenta MAD-698-R-SB12]OSX61274.1 glycosyltransferase family 24 protein [Postia placenta MAD-698-R-SB12]